MAYYRSSTLVVQRSYTNDTLGRPLSRRTIRNGQTVNDSFIYNSHSELASAQVNGATYSYNYDNIGNLRIAIEASDYTLYEANELNQYTSIQENEDAAFSPTFDADGNQTLIKTSTGIWTVAYNAENRPTSFTSADGSIVVECSYDTLGRRATKKVTNNGNIMLHQRYIYRGYLQIACCDLTRMGHPCLWFITWDPTQTTATRPLAIRKDGTWYAYGWDLTKNICEVFGSAGFIRTAYTYSPYGEVNASGDVEQQVQWSSEIFDEELCMSYYNYRQYNQRDGKWTGRDYSELEGKNLYAYTRNHFTYSVDLLGRASCEVWTGMANEPSTCTKVTTDCSTWNCAGSVRRYNETSKCCEYRTTIQKEDYTPSYDGCGSGRNEAFVPDGAFLPACIQHDICYGTCGTKRATCDNQFKQNLYSICEALEQEWRSRPRYDFIGDLVHGSGLYLDTCKRIANTYYEVVNHLGETPFENAQNKACEWHKCTKS